MSAALRVLVTGASSGIGEAVAHEYAARGAQVALFARRRERLEAVAAECRRRGAAEALVVAGDTTARPDVHAAAGALVAAWNGVDRAYLNAGGGNIGRDRWHYLDCCSDDATGAAHFSADAAEHLMRTNYLGQVYWLEELFAIMRGAGGAIAITGSMAADNLLPRSGPYTASKMALRGLVDGLRLDACGLGVQLTLIEPGFVVSEQTGGERDLPFLVDTPRAARVIVRGVERGRARIRVPWQLSVANRLSFLVPRPLYLRLAARRSRGP
jgi:NADP-dependent 3-hydroxy acid dehydrogenase YdfG